KREYVKITKDFPSPPPPPLSRPSSPPRTPPSSPTKPPQRTRKKPFHFIYISGEGATTTPLPSLLSPFQTHNHPWYAIVKGQAELALSKLSSRSPSNPNSNPFQVYSMRPGWVDPMSHPCIQPYIPQLSPFMNLMVCVLGPPIRVGYKKLWSPTEWVEEDKDESGDGKWEEEIRREEKMRSAPWVEL
ncbi:hypothetical protein QBC32DRAFT_224110, partial [Pseudoneurospora amorphoporcata]